MKLELALSGKVEHVMHEADLVLERRVRILERQVSDLRTVARVLNDALAALAARVAALEAAASVPGP